MHALIIEDDPIIAMLIEEELRELGFSSVDCTSTENEAIAAVARTSPDLITSDGSLIAGSGASAVRRIRATFAVPVIFITGDPAKTRDCAPGTCVLEKPFSIEQLVAAVEQVQPRLARG